MSSPFLAPGEFPQASSLQILSLLLGEAFRQEQEQEQEKEQELGPEQEQ